MKLEIKHLAPYLPYYTAFCVLTDKGWLKSPLLSLTDGLGLGSINHLLTSEKYKIELRPLSDLTKEIEHNGEMFIPSVRLGLHSGREQVRTLPKEFKSNEKGDVRFRIKGFCNYTFLEYSQTVQLLEWHFDVFGLIEKGLVVDINSIDNENQNSK